MATYNTAEDCHMTIATGDDSGGGSGLTQWDNNKAAFIIGELQAVDELLGWSCTPPTYKQMKIGQMSSGMIEHSIKSGIEEGIWQSKHRFQTCQFVFWLMQTTGTPTTEGTPTGYNTHTLTIGATNIPDWHGIHFEREGITSNELRYDLMGFLPSDIWITVSNMKEESNAIQEIRIPFAYLNAAASDLDTSGLTRPINTIGTIAKSWDHVITGNGGGITPSGLTYNNNQLEVDVKRIMLHLHRESMFGRPVRGYWADGLMGLFSYEVVLDVIPNGDLLYTVNRTAPQSYTGDLDYDFYFNADDTNDKIRFNFDKMQLQKFDEKNDWKQWFEGYTITLLPLDKTSSLTVTGIDGINNNGFENP